MLREALPEMDELEALTKHWDNNPMKNKVT
jgi:hypothetical protein